MISRSPSLANNLGRHNAARVYRNSAIRTSQRSYATVTDIDSYPKPGSQINGFTLRRSKHVPELQLTAFHLQHDKTGAEYLHIARDDKNNVFSVGFKTNPPDDTGVPHILEHTTLCGSKKYPVRDPFFKMLPRSLANFMNAYTASDYTTYPFATTNEKDFKNLLSVYLDATFNPLLKENDFTQEGWRIGPENPEAIADGIESTEADKRLVFKGVVYNEMKGQMSDASYLFYIRYQDHLFPDINNSGGDPQRMTDLTYEDLKNFHAEHYHPSNAKFFTYGNMPLADHLAEINRQLDTFQTIKADNAIKEPIKLDTPKEVIVPGPIDPLVDKDMQYKTSTSWILGDMSDVQEAFAIGIMSSLLLDGYGSPLYRGLIEAGLGPDFSPNTGFDSSGKVGLFCIGLNGVKEENVPTVKTAIQGVLHDVYKKGFDKQKVDGLLHQLELGLKHKTATFGMGLMQRLQPGWFNGVDPFDSLAWNRTIEEFKKRFARGGYLEELLEKYLLNDRTFTFTMKPSATYGQDLAAEETQRLSDKIAAAQREAGGAAEAHERLTARELELLKFQTEKQDMSCLPMVRVRDIPRERERKPVRDSKIGDVKVQWREAATNGLTYFRAINVLDGLPEELRSMVPLFSDAIMRLDTKSLTREQVEDMIKAKTGGISTSYFSTTLPTDLETAQEGISMSGFALDSKVTDMFDLLKLITQETDFDSSSAEAMIRQLLQTDANGALNAVANAGNAYARKFAEAGLSLEGAYTEQISGLSQVKTVTQLASRSTNQSLEDVISKLKAIQQFALSNSSKMRTAVTCGPEVTAANQTALSKFLTTLPSSTTIPSPASTSTTYSRNSKTFFPLPYQVYYSCQAYPTVPYTHADGAALQVLAQLLTHKHLLHEIREKGGAYGGGAYSKGLSGVFGFYSYRDPNPQNTMKIYDNAGRWARERVFGDLDLEEAKISVFQRVDAPESINQEGMTRFLSGIDEDMEQKKREQLLDVTKDDVKRVAEKYIARGRGGANLAVLGERKGWVDPAGGWDVREVNV